MFRASFLTLICAVLLGCTITTTSTSDANPLMRRQAPADDRPSYSYVPEPSGTWMAYDRSNRSRKPIPFQFKGRYVDAKWGGYPAHYGWKIKGNELHMHAATGRKVYNNIMLKWRWSPRNRAWIGISGKNRSYILTKRKPEWYRPARETRPDPLYRRQVPERDTHNRYNVPVPSGTWKAYDRSDRSRKPLPFDFKGRYVDVKWKGYPAHYGWKIKGNELHMHAATGRKVYNNIMQKWRWSARRKAYVGISGNNKNLILTKDQPEWYRPPSRKKRRSNPLFHRQKPEGSFYYDYRNPVSPTGERMAYPGDNRQNRLWVKDNGREASYVQRHRQECL